MPAENDPAEPNALTQSLQLTCSLTPSSTVPSTWLVTIWLKRWLPRSPIDAPLEPAPVGPGRGQAPTELASSVPLLFGRQLCAAAGATGRLISISTAAADSAADMMKFAVNLAIVSARTACRWGRCRRRPVGLSWAWHRQGR